MGHLYQRGRCCVWIQVYQDGQRVPHGRPNRMTERTWPRQAIKKPRGARDPQGARLVAARPRRWYMKGTWRRISLANYPATGARGNLAERE